VSPVPYDALDGLLLDLGNTLVGMDAALVCDALAAEGVRAEPDGFRRAEAAARPALSSWIVRPPTSEPVMLAYVRAVVARLGVGEGARTAVAARVLARLRRVPTDRLWSEVLPGVPAALARLRAAGRRLVVVSNSDGTAEAGLVRAGLRDFVDAVVDSAVFGVEKPDPRIFAHALTLVPVPPERLAHVGDLYDVDALGARAAGLHAVLLDPHGDWPGVDCDTVPTLAALVDRLLGPSS
jgi:putative hydrolase of the HAD superfamily